MKWIGQHIYDLAARFRGDVTIEGDLTVNGTYTQIDTDVTTTEQWLVTNDGTGPAAIINQKGSQDIFDVQDDGTSVFYIEDGGNVGIGTTAPSQALDVFGNIKMQNNNALMSENVAGGTRSLIALGSDNVLRIKGNDSEGSSNVISMVNGGNVGIGTTSPSSKLEVISGDNVGTTKIISAYSLSESQSTSLGYNSVIGSYSLDIKTLSTQPIKFSPNNSEAMRIDSSGNVGIGTTSPASKLDVVGGYDATPVKFLRHATYGNIIQLGRNSVSETAHIGYPGDATLNFSTAGSEKMRITSAGNVGIGTTSPGYKLHVAGNADISGDLSGVDTLTATTLSVTNYGLASADIPNNAANTTGVAYGLNGAAGSLLTAPAQNQLLYTGQISNGVSGLFAASNNSNSVITLNRHYGNYDSQLGFSSNGNVYYRKFSGSAINTSQAWKTMAFTDSDISGNAGTVTNGVYTDTHQTITGNKTFSGLTTVGAIIPSEIALSANVTSDHNFNGTTLSGNELGTTDGTSVSQGHLVYLSTTGSWEKTDSDALATSFGMLAIQGSGDQSKQLVVNGLYNLGYDPGGNMGDPLYISGTVGLITSTAPTGTGDIVRIVGYKMHATSGLIYFNPDQTWVELT